MKWRGQNKKVRREATEVIPRHSQNTAFSGEVFLSEQVPLRFEDIFKCANEQEAIWRMKGYLDCLRAMNQYGPPDPKFVEYLVEKTGEQAP